MQQRTAEQFEDAPQSLAGVVKAVTFAPRESEVVASGTSQ